MNQMTRGPPNTALAQFFVHIASFASMSGGLSTVQPLLDTWGSGGSFSAGEIMAQGVGQTIGTWEVSTLPDDIIDYLQLGSAHNETDVVWDVDHPFADQVHKIDEILRSLSRRGQRKA